MHPMTSSEICDLLKGILKQGSEQFLITGATKYIRLLKTDMLLFLNTHWRIDWNTIKKALPCTVVTDRWHPELEAFEGCTVILVTDVETAYWQFVSYYRSLFYLPVIAVTGTSGKTTTKDMIKHMLQFSFSVTGTVNSANGRTGHLDYLLRIDKATQAAVFETAVGGPGDITYACRHFKPNIGVITNVGIDHIDGCHTLDSYIQAKGEMVAGVADDGVLIVNSDDYNSKKISLENYEGRIVYFGVMNKAHYQASDIVYCEQGMKFTLHLSNTKYPLLVPGFGHHQVYNALAALAAVHQLGVGIHEGAERLKTFSLSPRHLQVHTGVGLCTFIDDTWNLNTTSLKAALDTLLHLGNSNKKVVMLGEIGALGPMAGEVLQDVGIMLAEAEPDILIAVGSMAIDIVQYAKIAGLKGETYTFIRATDVLPLAEQIFDHNTMVLAKCSMFHKDFKETVKKLIL